jgi:type IV secretion system protein VirB11
MSAVPSSFTATSLDRRIQMLRTAMGPLIAAALEDPDVVEIMLNPDRTLWVDRLSTGRAPMGVELSEADGERIIRLVAAHVGTEVHRGQPLLTAELPETGERFEGILPPAAPGPAFALRKRAFGVIPLSRYIEDGMMTAAQAGLLVRAVRERQNILIAGGTSTGKTTLANALLAEIAATGDRVLVLEDTVELQCAARDHVPLRTRQGVVSMTELVRSSMRLRPDRVIVGEVRGAEALDLIKVWGTGHPGGIAGGARQRGSRRAPRKVRRRGRAARAAGPVLGAGGGGGGAAGRLPRRLPHAHPRIRVVARGQGGLFGRRQRQCDGRAHAAGGGGRRRPAHEPGRVRARGRRAGRPAAVDRRPLLLCAAPPARLFPALAGRLRAAGLALVRLACRRRGAAAPRRAAAAAAH